MNHWAFVTAAYAVALAATVGLLAWAYATMRKAEAGGGRAEAPEMIARPKHQRLVLVILAAARGAWRRLARHVGPQGPGGLFLHASRHCCRQGEPGQGDAARRDGRARLREARARRRDDALHRRRRQGARARSPIAASSPTCFVKAAGSSPRASSPPTAAFVADNILAKHDERYMPPELGNQRPSTRPGRRSGDDRRGRPRRALASGRAVAARTVPQRPPCRAAKLDADRPVRALAIVQGLLCLIAFVMLLARLCADRSVGRCWSPRTATAPSPSSTRSPARGGTTRARCSCGSPCSAFPGAALAVFSHRLAEPDLDRGARRPGRACARLPRLPAVRVQPVRAARSRRRWRAGG